MNQFAEDIYTETAGAASWNQIPPARKVGHSMLASSTATGSWREPGNQTRAAYLWPFAEPVVGLVIDLDLFERMSECANKKPSE